MRALEILAAITFAGLLTSTAEAERLQRLITDVTPTSDTRGGSRILFRCDPSIAEGHVAIRRAVLRFDLAGAAQEKSLMLRVYPVTAAWSDGRAPVSYDAELWSHAELDLRRSGTVSFDVTNVVKEIVEEGLTTYGFLVAADAGEGAGLSSTDLERFAGLSAGSIEVVWRNVPPPPRAVQRSGSAARRVRATAEILDDR